MFFSSSPIRVVTPCQLDDNRARLAEALGATDNGSAWVRAPWGANFVRAIQRRDGLRQTMARLKRDEDG